MSPFLSNPAKFLAFALVGLFSFPAGAGCEMIKNFESTIRVNPDASVTVSERITVNREGKRIKRGIFRTLPLTRGVEYRVVSVRRDEKPEPWFTENANGRFRINTGTDKFLPRDGLYTFEITYRASNTVRAFDGYDEIYWNVTGNDWDFPIERAAARVIVPDGAKILQTAGYTGKRGSKTPAGFDPETGVFSTSYLNPNEGLTVAVGFEKGYVDALPVPLRDRIPARLTAIVLLGYLVVTWALYGKDPEKPAVMPRFDAIPDVTPAMAHFIDSYGRDDGSSLSAALLQGGVSGFLKIRRDGKDDFTIEKARAPKNGEEKILDRNLLFPVRLNGKYSAEMNRCRKALKNFLAARTADCFAANRGLVAGALALLLGSAAFQLRRAGAPHLIALLAFYLLFLVPAAKGVLAMIATKTFKFAPVFIFAFVAFHFSMMTLTAAAANPDIREAFVFYAAGGLAVLIYAHLIVRPTRRGQDVSAHIDGIKMFLKAVDTNIPTPVNCAKMERLLPYAVLFGLEKEWEDKMRRLTDMAQYRPSWYSGNCFRAADFGGFNSCAATACAPPSHSGSGGGGCSGGGCGGGGGGGR